MTMITPSYLGETIEYSSLHACRSTLEDPTELLSRWLAANPEAKLRLLGVVLTELTPAAQLGLFEDQPGPARLDAALDEVRGRFGSQALRRGNTIE